MQNLERNVVREFIYYLPKAELHVHLEGTMEPEQLLHFAQRNSVKMPYNSVREIKDAYVFSDLASFINIYIEAAQVLCSEQDFYDLTFAYLKKASEQGVCHTEIFFNLQTYLPRNIAPSSIIHGIDRALYDAFEKFGISGHMILCFLRHLSEEEAFKVLELSLPFKDKIIGIGLASLEEGHPPSKFQRVFEKAKSYGYRIVAHEGECSSKCMLEALDSINIERIDHGIHVMESPELINEFVHRRIPFTVCPLSNVALNVVDNIKKHPLKEMINAGLIVTINSDDPAFFGGYIAENYYQAFEHMNLSLDDIIQCAYNSIHASFTHELRKQECLNTLNKYVEKFKGSYAIDFKKTVFSSCA